MPHLPDVLSGLTIQVVADLHVRSAGTASLRALDELSDTRPDLLFACGDLIDNSDITPLVARALAAIRPRYGAYAVWGNHDLLGPAKPHDPNWLGERTQPLRFMREAFEACGVTVLDNCRVHCHIAGTEIAIVGIGDATKGRDEACHAFHLADDNMFTIVMTHNPDAVMRLGSARVDLVVCGHTHGGQIVAPFMPAITTSTRYPLPRPSGLMHIAERLTFITRGVGTVGIPLRINAPAEAPVLSLVRAGPAA